ncbi:copper-translocating P-type ATPase [Rhodovarius crocodyli]|uniref:P-type Cu(+) transporter n=1 Tax=Rhodovarius crocodyli TaxID=1979269 RepID=A0A437MFC2_9PROT|nr:heavy metal translocating P-type ATPase [Rhodovarius crocodyli]RVT96329.1 copper-translocating P-type ATPase [Rhodovarius crocodyli]
MSQTTLSLPVEGMTCASCVGRVERAIAAVPGVHDASVNLASNRASFSVDSPEAARAAAAAIERAGYEPVAESRDYSITGMTCASCVARVERAILAVPGVTAASVNLATERASVRGLGVAPAAIIAAVERAGYEAAPAEGASAARLAEETARREAEEAGLRRDTLLAVLLSAPLFVVEMGGHLFPALHHALDHAIGMQTLWVVEFLLASAVLFFPGLRFQRHGWPALLRAAPDMNTLVAVGAGAAWAYSSVTTFLPFLLPEDARHVYFEAAAVIVALILLGRLLEARSKGQASEAIRRLMRLQSRTARVERDGTTSEIAIEALAAGDVVVLRPGERVPTDGEVIDGSALLDESMLTGEPVPVRKQAGDRVTGGTLATDGGLRFRATAVGGETVLAQILAMVEGAQAAKLPIQAVVDRITLWFVPAVMAIATLTALIWLFVGGDISQALVNGVAVLIIACPCAMGLATPTSIMVGTGRAAELGVIFRRGDALQRLGETAILAVDKTGTLTEGHPKLTDMLGDDTLLPLIAAAESRSEHPLAAAIVGAARERGLTLPEVEQFEPLPGRGLVARVAGREVAIGSARMMAERGVDFSALEGEAARLAGLGRTPFLVALDGQAASVIAVADPIRESTPAAVAALKEQGLRVVMVSGDNRRTAEAIAAQLGIAEVRAEVLPADKLAIVEELRGQAPTAFLGDGINDAPALAAADVGIAIGTGTDVALESAEVVLMGGDLSGVARAVGLSRATMRNIRQNLFWAFAYNAALIPVAAAGLLSPMLAAAAMGVSSVFVVTNALRLRRFAG